MPAASYFSSPFHQVANPAYSVADGSKRAKRKRVEEEDLTDSDHGDSLLSKSELLTKLGRDDGEAYYTAGITSPEQIPGGNFPHSEAPTLGHDSTLSQTKSEVASAKLRLSDLTARPHTPTNYTKPKVKSSQYTHHVTILNTIMQKFIHEGDYVRAGRAFGMLLRARMNGQPIDIRMRGFWGIGGEILLRRDAQLAESRSRALDLHPEPDKEETQKINRADVVFSKEGSEKARNYYETLILTYPYRRHAPEALSSLHFYVVMFGLWIFQVQEQFVSRLSGHLLDKDGSSIESENEDESTSSARDVADQQETSQNSILQQVRMISDRLDEILLSPPYSDDPDLWKLRGMVALWAGNLCIRKKSAFSHSDRDERSDSQNGDEEFDGQLESMLEHRERMKAKQAHIRIAGKAFKNADVLLARPRTDTTPQLFSATDP